MKITQEGNKIRFALVERLPGNDWKKLFDFTIYKTEFENLKEHMIKALQDFKLDD